MEEHSVDLLYLASNRLEFTRETFTTLIANTDWRFVNELFVYDDGSTDGTREWLAEAVGRVSTRVRFLKTNFGSPVTAMTHFIESARAPMLAKSDNDAMLPPAWLRQSLEVFDRHPELDLLGIEAMYPSSGDVNLPRSYTPAIFISGLGLYRRSVFGGSRPAAYEKWFGLEEWQVARGAALSRGWITPALPVFLLDRIPFAPWSVYSDGYIQRGWQRSWPKYDAQSTLWHWRWPSGKEADPPDRRFLCAMRVKNESAHIRDVIAAVLPLCGRVLVFDDHSTDDTAAVCRAFGSRVAVHPSPFSGLDEARDKNYLLRQVAAESPDWVLWIDGDEVLESSGPARLRQAAEQWPAASAFSLRIAYLWDDPLHVRVDGLFGRFARPSMFRLRGQTLGNLYFPASGRGGNFHCGNVPLGLAGESRTLDVRLKHYGYVSREQREAKYRWYTTLDPGNAGEDFYRHIGGVPGARFAPGPPQLVPWVEATL